MLDFRFPLLKVIPFLAVLAGTQAPSFGQASPSISQVVSALSGVQKSAVESVTRVDISLDEHHVQFGFRETWCLSRPHSFSFRMSEFFPASPAFRERPQITFAADNSEWVRIADFSGNRWTRPAKTLDSPLFCSSPQFGRGGSLYLLMQLRPKQALVDCRELKFSRKERVGGHVALLYKGRIRGMGDVKLWLTQKSLVPVRLQCDMRSDLDDYLCRYSATASEDSAMKRARTLQARSTTTFRQVPFTQPLTPRSVELPAVGETVNSFWDDPWALEDSPIGVLVGRKLPANLTTADNIGLITDKMRSVTTLLEFRFTGEDGKDAPVWASQAKLKRVVVVSAKKPISPPPEVLWDRGGRLAFSLGLKRGTYLLIAPDRRIVRAADKGHARH